MICSATTSERDNERTTVSVNSGRIWVVRVPQTYNRDEFDTDELIRRIREWTEAMLQLQPATDLCTTPEPSPR
jgi:hypothetical protein